MTTERGMGCSVCGNDKFFVMTDQPQTIRPIDVVLVCTMCGVRSDGTVEEEDLKTNMVVLP